ncbi:unnamed protein product [Camellia sinensis]
MSFWPYPKRRLGNSSTRKPSNWTLECQEDYFIKPRRLIRLWIGEGFVEEQNGKTLEESIGVKIQGGRDWGFKGAAKFV